MQNQMKIYSDSLETNTCIASLIKAEVLSWTAKFNIGYNTDTLQTHLEIFMPHFSSSRAAIYSKY